MKNWVEAHGVDRERQAILAATDRVDDQSEGTLHVVLKQSTLVNYWGAIKMSLLEALQSTYQASILDSNRDFGREILISIPKESAGKFKEDLGKVQATHRAEDVLSRLR